MTQLKPILKWVGGKTQLLPTLRKKIVAANLHHGLYDGTIPYLEPFIGGGALFLDLQPKDGWINDQNGDLIRFYQAVRDKSSQCIQAFDSLVQVAEKIDLEEFYYSLRNSFVYSKLDSVHVAKFYFLNKTCFNGLYRVNSEGVFNVPFNKSKTPPKLDYDNFLAVSRYLKSSNTSITNLDALKLLENFEDRPALIYLDPPYVPVKQGSFVSYTSTLDKDFHTRLAKIAHNLANENHHVMISNSDCDEVQRLYSSDVFHVCIVDARGSVNCDGTNRKRTETIISNF